MVENTRVAQELPTVPLFSSEKFKAKKSKKKNQSFEKYPDFSISNMNIAKEK